MAQKPVDVLLSEFGPLYSDLTFRGLAIATYYYPNSNDEVINLLFQALRAFRENRELSKSEARFRQLATIAETLAKRDPRERLIGCELRERIAKISTNGWSLYTSFNSSSMPDKLSPEQYSLIWNRYDEMGWSSLDEAIIIIKDLWDNVRNPLSHELNTFSSLNRDAYKDIANMERVIITMINGLYAAWEVQELVDEPIYDILLNDDRSESACLLA